MVCERRDRELSHSEDTFVKILAYILRRDKLYDSYLHKRFQGKIWIVCWRCNLRVRVDSGYTDDKEELIFCSRGCAERHEQDEARKQ